LVIQHVVPVSILNDPLLFVKLKILTVLPFRNCTNRWMLELAGKPARTNQNVFVNVPLFCAVVVVTTTVRRMTRMIEKNIGKVM
jgi:hypothetical protein